MFVYTYVIKRKGKSNAALEKAEDGQQVRDRSRETDIFFMNEKNTINESSTV